MFTTKRPRSGWVWAFVELGLGIRPLCLSPLLSQGAFRVGGARRSPVREAGERDQGSARFPVPYVTLARFQAHGSWPLIFSAERCG